MATVGRTFIDPDKYEQNWFLSLPMEHKYLYMYCWERCDHAGVLEVSEAMWSFHTNMSINRELINRMIESCNQGKQRILDLGSKIWFTEYIRFNQQTDPTKGLSSSYSFHKHVFGRLVTHDLVNEANRRDPILLRDFKHLFDDENAIPKPSVSLPQVLPKQTGKEAGKGGGNGTGLGGDQGGSDYELSKTLAEKLDVNFDHETVKEIQSLAIKLRAETGDQKPHELIDSTLENLKEFYTQPELTINLLVHETEKEYLQKEKTLKLKNS